MDSFEYDYRKNVIAQSFICKCCNKYFVLDGIELNIKSKEYCSQECKSQNKGE